MFFCASAAEVQASNQICAQETWKVKSPWHGQAWTSQDSVTGSHAARRDLYLEYMLASCGLSSEEARSLTNKEMQVLARRFLGHAFVDLDQ